MKTVSKVALAAMGALFVLGVVTYKDRVLFSDAALRIFNMILNSKIEIFCSRYGAFVVQVLPLVAEKIHLPLKIILFLHGISYNLFYLLVAFIIYRIRQYSLAILMSLYYFIFISVSYIWVNELFQGVAWMFLFFAVTVYMGNKKTNIYLFIPIFIALAFVTIVSHFIVMIPMLFLWIYFIVEKKTWPFSLKHSLILTGILALVVLVKLLLFSSDPYDTTLLQGVFHFVPSDLPGAFLSTENRAFYARCLTVYWIGTIITIISIFSLVKYRRFFVAIWTSVCLLGYLVSMGLTYGKTNSSLLLHIESEWSCIGIVAATGFVFCFLPRLKVQAAIVLVTVIFLIRFIYIADSVWNFSQRSTMNEKILSQMRKKHIDKLVLINYGELTSFEQIIWCLPIETLMMSALDGDRPNRTFLFADPNDTTLLRKVQNPDGFFDGTNIRPHLFSNTSYFSVDTLHPYQVMTYQDLMN